MWLLVLARLFLLLCMYYARGGNSRGVDLHAKHLLVWPSFDIVVILRDIV